MISDCVGRAVAQVPFRSSTSQFPLLNIMPGTNSALLYSNQMHSTGNFSRSCQISFGPDCTLDMKRSETELGNDFLRYAFLSLR